MQSVSTSYILKAPSASWNCFSEFKLLLHEPYQELNTIFKKSTLPLLEIILSIGPNIRRLENLTKLAHCVSDVKGVYVIGADVQIHDHWIFSFSLSFSLWYKKSYFLTSICDKLLGPKYRVFVKLSHVKLFLWVKVFNWAQTETSNSSSTVSVVQWYFEKRNISVGLWQLFRQFIVENLIFI